LWSVVVKRSTCNMVIAIENTSDLADDFSPIRNSGAMKACVPPPIVMPPAADDSPVDCFARPKSQILTCSRFGNA
jgi:hypothetical protein